MDTYIYAALDHSPRHRPMLERAIRATDGSLAAIAAAVGRVCRENNIRDLPNPYPRSDAERRALWEAAFDSKWTDEQIAAIRAEDRPALTFNKIASAVPAETKTMPDFDTFPSKPAILQWAANNLHQTVNQRLTRPNLIASVREIALSEGWTVG